eukprot:GHVT01076314.1.p1 GENE.GHVT01076314.1~~GHVT01076314.1.p1  ORF type:complete len:453 (-),score=108.46 GHVT01076314.1:388-1746(-)
MDSSAASAVGSAGVHTGDPTSKAWPGPRAPALDAQTAASAPASAALTAAAQPFARTPQLSAGHSQRVSRKFTDAGPSRTLAATTVNNPTTSPPPPPPPPSHDPLHHPHHPSHQALHPSPPAAAAGSSPPLSPRPAHSSNVHPTVASAHSGPNPTLMAAVSAGLVPQRSSSSTGDLPRASRFSPQPPPPSFSSDRPYAVAAAPAPSWSVASYAAAAVPPPPPPPLGDNCQGPSGSFPRDSVSAFSPSSSACSYPHSSSSPPPSSPPFSSSCVVRGNSGVVSGALVVGDSDEEESVPVHTVQQMASDQFTACIDLNSFADWQRMVKLESLQMIRRHSGAVVVARGKMKPDVLTPGKGLHLHISADSEEKAKTAVLIIEKLMAVPPLVVTANRDAARDQNFQYVKKLQGEDAANIQFIINKSKAFVHLVGGNLNNDATFCKNWLLKIMNRPLFRY